jgi:2-polyprenyl-3-methyl-5-hydroxy-6-metoxy-1,4-benzoquinol methylase
MTQTKPIIENGIIAGNLYDKHGSNNIIVKYLMNAFHTSLDKLVAKADISTIHEIGCGEGILSIGWAKQNIQVQASDFSQQVINIAEKNARESKVDIEFKTASIYDLKPGIDDAELIVCCEVLEHLDRPKEGMKILTELAKPYLLVSVPHEPLWSCLNMLRGKYISRLGNTPGHIQKWSKRSFLKFLSSYVDVIEVLTPTPWIMVLCRAK